MREVRCIDAEQAKPWLLNKHYARRTPGISHAFGLYVDGLLQGVVTYGALPTPQVKNGMFSDKGIEIIELNRLCVDSAERNASGYLVSRSLRLLPKPLAVISYADGGQGHVGYVYQAANFLFTGSVTAHDSEYLIGGKKIHPRTLAAQGVTNPAKWARENNIERVRPKPKNRYVYLVGSRKDVRHMRASLLYPVIKEYPKGESSRYDAGGDVPVQMVMF